MDVLDLINHIHYLTYKESDCLKGIKDVNMLIDGLHELNNMIEMTEAKKSIVQQIKHLIVSNRQIKNNKSAFDGHLLHTVLFGPPGCGKTNLGKILAKIWLAIGVISLPKTKKVANCDDFNHQLIIKEHALLSAESKALYMNQINLQLKLLVGYTYTSMISDNINTLSKNLLKVKSSISSKNKDTLSSISSKLNDLQNIIEPIPDIYFDQRTKFLQKLDDEKKKLENENKNKIPISIVTRADFVAKYMGQTTAKTKKLLEDNLGGILLIDEAYTLIVDEKDTYGMEAATELNQFMSEHAGDIIIIFAGYKDLLEQSLFKHQPGLRRRCNWVFEITGYSPKAISDIFIRQLGIDGWKLDENINIVEFFTENASKFPHYGGDTSRLCFFAKIAHSDAVFENTDKYDKIITMSILESAMKSLTSNQINKNIIDTPEPYGMYN